MDETSQLPKLYQGEVMAFGSDAGATPELYLALAQVIEDSNTAKGIPRLDQAIAKYRPREPEFYFQLGQAYARTSQREEAAQRYRQALDISPAFMPAWRALTNLLASGKPDESDRAITTAQNALRALGHADAGLLNDLGAAYLRRGNVEDAVETLRLASGIGGNLSSAANLLGLALFRKGDGSGAEAAFRQALRIRPGLAEAHCNLANLLAARHNLGEAAFHFEKAIAFRPEYAEAHHGYALVLMMIRSWDRAIAEMESTVRLQPEIAATHEEFADLLLAAGQSGKAMIEYRRAIELNPKLAEACYRLALVLLGAGNLPEAKVQLRIV